MARAKFIKSDKAMTPGDKITAYKYLEGNNVIEGKGLFIVSEDDKSQFCECSSVCVYKSYQEP